ncbi:CPBP family intramembrane glutamic endopeptidase [Halobacterium hubeiense]|uniref:CPBP family intramembrane glutamic endopeptidase n=1 Tax=Halobacterium hubeiense TaxID=1407499 RepID=UPI003C72050C
MTPTHSFRRRFAATFLAGVPGVMALSAYVYATVDPAAVPGGLTRPAYAVAAAANPLVLLAAACVLGAYTAPRIGFQSYLAERAEGDATVWSRLRDDLPLAVGLGVGGAVVVVALDVAFAAFVADDLVAVADPGTVGDVLAYAPVRFLYGGVTEELLLRYGLMSALAFAGWKLTGSPARGPSAAVVWVAVVVAAVLFGVAHLPALAASVDLTPALVARTVLLNALAGLAFGWLYWRRSLEAAMVAHAAFHVPLVALSPVTVA